MKRISLVLLAGLCLAAAPSDPPAGEKAARQAALDFIKCYKARDLDGALGCSSVPWLYDFTITFKTEEDLKNHLRLSLKPTRKSEVFSDKVQYVKTYPELRAKIRAYHAKWIDEVLTKDDYVVAVQQLNQPKFNILVFVRMKDGKGKVVGYAGD
jgi:hypothetical protein